LLSEKPVKNRLPHWFTNRVLPVLSLLVVITISVGIFSYRTQVAELGNYGYLGTFFISLISNASVVLPVPGLVIIFALGAAFQPLLVGLFSGVGAAVGEITGYMVGYSGRSVAQRSKLYDRTVDWVKRWGAIAIFVFTVVPFFPFDLAGIAAGVLRYPFRKFLLICWLGRTLLYIGVALAGARGWDALTPYFS